MNIWIRRTYFFISVVVFAIIATLLIFYASGWRYDTNTKTVGKVGVLSVNSEPNNANVYLDGKLLKDKTPISANNLFADEYRLLTWKEGYYDWQQNISIHESLTTYIPHVFLVKQQTLDNPYLSSKIEFYKLSNDNKLIAYQSGQYFIIHNLETNKQIHKELVSENITNFYWNNNNTSIIFKNKDGFFIFDLNGNNFQSINDLFAIKPATIFWSDNESNIIYALEDNNLFRINKFQETKELIFSEKNIIHQYGDYFFILNNSNSLSVINAAGSIIDVLDLNSEYSLTFNDPINGFLPIIDVSNDKGNYFDLDNLTFISINKDINSIDYINSNNLLYANSHEIWQIDNMENTQNLLIRTSENINSAYWLIDNQYIIYTTDNNQIKISEVNRSTNNTYEINHQIITKLERGYKDNIFFLINELGIYKLEF